MPKQSKRAARARPVEAYCAIFMPVDHRWKDLRIRHYDMLCTLSFSPAVAKARFLDRLPPGEKWIGYARAGWRIRRIAIKDMGGA